jgi:hypothetical protein
MNRLHFPSARRKDCYLWDNPDANATRHHHRGTRDHAEARNSRFDL